MAYRTEGSLIQGIPDPPPVGTVKERTLDEAWVARYQVKGRKGSTMQIHNVWRCTWCGHTTFKLQDNVLGSGTTIAECMKCNTLSANPSRSK